MKTEFNKFKQSVLILENEYEHMELCLKSRTENPLVQFAQIGGGIMFGILSFCWVLHIFIYMVFTDSRDQPAGLFLNGILDEMEKSDFFVLAAILFALLNVYLLFCVMKGCLKVGMRAFCCCEIHPMRSGKTPINSMMYNCILILLTSCAIGIKVLLFNNNLRYKFMIIMSINWPSCNLIFGYQMPSKL